MRPKLTAAKKQLAVEHLHSVLSYRPETGFFYWKHDRGPGRPKAGGRAGGVCHPMGYRAISVLGNIYKEHQLAWFYVHGEWSMMCLDHINNQHGDNRIANLRQATHSQNIANRKVNANSRVGIKGVYPRGKRFGARINIHGKIVDLGRFDTAQEAHEAYCAAASELHGEFMRAG